MIVLHGYSGSAGNCGSKVIHTIRYNGVEIYVYEGEELREYTYKLPITNVVTFTGLDYLSVTFK